MLYGYGREHRRSLGSFKGITVGVVNVCGEHGFYASSDVPKGVVAAIGIGFGGVEDAGEEAGGYVAVAIGNARGKVGRETGMGFEG